MEPLETIQLRTGGLVLVQPDLWRIHLALVKTSQETCLSLLLDRAEVQRVIEALQRVLEKAA